MSREKFSAILSHILLNLVYMAARRYPYYSTFRMIEWLDLLLKYSIVFILVFPILVVNHWLSIVEKPAFLITLAIFVVDLLVGYLLFKSQHPGLTSELTLQKTAFDMGLRGELDATEDYYANLQKPRLSGNQEAWKKTISFLNKDIEDRGYIISDERDSKIAAGILTPVAFVILTIDIMIIILILFSAFESIKLTDISVSLLLIMVIGLASIGLLLASEKVRVWLVNNKH